MSIQETEWDDFELYKNYRRILEGKRDISFFTKTNILMLIDFAEQKKIEAIEFIALLLLNNPDTNFDFWAVRHSNYKDAEFVLNWLRAAQIDSKVDLPEKQKPEQETPKTFDELFYNTELVEPCIDILKGLDPPLIDTDCNYIGRLKGVFCVWIDEMKRQGIVKSGYPEERKLFASLIPQKINRFKIDESMFGKHQSKAENLYRTDIKTKVSKIKLSLNSQ